MKRRLLAVTVSLAAFLSGADGQATIYGNNDLKQFYEPDVDTRLFDAEVMLVRVDNLQASGSGYEIVNAPTLGEFIQSLYGYPLCPTERYSDEPVVGFCSGFMVAEDLIATAGHCVTDRRECAATRFVSGYHVPELGAVPPLWIPASDVYGCARIVERISTATEDWALLRTDRPIAGHTPLPLRREGVIALGANLAMVGHPNGLPAKYVANATVKANAQQDYFEANIDTYAGNAGSPVVGLDGEGVPVVEGILVRGNPDWAVVIEGGYCNQSYACSDNGCTGWEEVTRSALFAQLVPDRVCGDLRCGADESCATCPADCGACTSCLGRKRPCSSSSDCCSGSCSNKSGRCR